ncbi:MAG: DedA family protein [Chthonomonadales bacterium]|nr:DedA family protein [Chthonomonadales bacterium]
MIGDFIDLILHLDRHLDGVFRDYGSWTYAILFVIVFCETGLVVTPFLPGDSLLFAAGALAGRGSLELQWVLLTLGGAAFAGDNCNYWFGRLLGPKLLRSEKSRWLNRQHLDRTHAFFERYGGKTIIMARFVPIVRTFTPFVAGIGAMTYPRFLSYSLAATSLWLFVCAVGGYYFGSLKVVRENFSLAVLMIIVISVLPAIVEFVKHRRSQPTHEIVEGDRV